MMETYLKNLIEADCRASQLRVLAQGPPVYIEVFVNQYIKYRKNLYSQFLKENMLSISIIPAQTLKRLQK